MLSIVRDAKAEEISSGLKRARCPDRGVVDRSAIATARGEREWSRRAACTCQVGKESGYRCIGAAGWIEGRKS